MCEIAYDYMLVGITLKVFFCMQGHAYMLVHITYFDKELAVDWVPVVAVVVQRGSQHSEPGVSDELDEKENKVSLLNAVMS